MHPPVCLFAGGVHKVSWEGPPACTLPVGPLRLRSQPGITLPFHPLQNGTQAGRC